MVEGKGINFYSNGNRYEGDFKKGKMIIKGILEYSNGDRYEGEIQNLQS